MTQNKAEGDKNHEAASNQTMENQDQKETPGEVGTLNERVVGVDIGTSKIGSSKIVFSEKKNGKNHMRQKRYYFTLGMVLILFLLFLPQPAMTAIIHVAKSSGDFTNIQQAVNASNSGDVIKVHPGTYHETVTINKANLTIEAYDPAAPPEIDGADQNFANNLHTWQHVQGNVYKTDYSFPFPHITPEAFSRASIGDPLITVYEDDIWLRGYEGAKWDGTSRPYNTLEDLDPYTEPRGNYSEIDRRIPGRFMYDSTQKDLYIWTAQEHGENHPRNHKYSIPILKHLFIISAPGATLRHLVLKHTYYYAISVRGAGDGTTIEHCYIINTGPWAIQSSNVHDLTIHRNFIQLRGFYERQDYMSVRFNQLKSFLIKHFGFDAAANGRITENVVMGTYGMHIGGQDTQISHNIVSRSQDTLIFPYVEAGAPTGYVHNARVHNNILHHALTGFCSYDSVTGPIWFYRNVLYICRRLNKDGQFSGMPSASRKTYVYHNTYALGETTALHSYAYPNNKNTVYRNNIIHLRHKYMEMYWNYLEKDPAKGWSYDPFIEGPDSDYNLFWRDPANTWNVIARFDLRGEPIIDYKVGEFSLMRAVTGMDPHGREANPQFVNPEIHTADVFTFKVDTFSEMQYSDVISSGYDSLYNQHFKSLYNYFLVSNTSPVINSGEPLPVAWPDSVGVSDGLPDVGPIEFGWNKMNIPPISPSGFRIAAD